MKRQKNVWRSKLAASSVRVRKLTKKVFLVASVTGLASSGWKASEMWWSLLGRRSKGFAQKRSKVYFWSICQKRELLRTIKFTLSFAIVVVWTQSKEFVTTAASAPTMTFVLFARVREFIKNTLCLRLEILPMRLVARLACMKTRESNPVSPKNQELMNSGKTRSRSDTRVVSSRKALGTNTRSKPENASSRSGPFETTANMLGRKTCIWFKLVAMTCNSNQFKFLIKYSQAKIMFGE